MPGLQLSAEICSKIVRSMGSRRAHRDLVALCLTCKALQREAEIRLYDSVVCSDVTRAQLACRTLSQTERLALLVHSFWFNDESRRPQPLPQHFWTLVQSALSRMQNLLALSLFDVSHANGWVLDPAHIRFQLHEAKVHFTWDEHLIQFLESQKKLQILQTFDRDEDVARAPIAHGSLPLLKRFDGTMLVALHMLSSPLKNLQITIEEGARIHLLDFLSQLWSVHKTLRALSMLEIPDSLAADALDLLASTCPNLIYIGLIPLPPIQRHHIYKSLMHMHSLHAIQFDVFAWSPHPDVRAQRAIAAEIRTFCPTVREIIFWLGGMRVRWIFSQQWQSSIELQQYSPFDPMWSLV